MFFFCTHAVQHITHVDGTLLISQNNEFKLWLPNTFLAFVNKCVHLNMCYLLFTLVLLMFDRENVFIW